MVAPTVCPIAGELPTAAVGARSGVATTVRRRPSSLLDEHGTAAAARDPAERRARDREIRELARRAPERRPARAHRLRADAAVGRRRRCAGSQRTSLRSGDRTRTLRRLLRLAAAAPRRGGLHVEQNWALESGLYELDEQPRDRCPGRRRAGPERSCPCARPGEIVGVVSRGGAPRRGSARAPRSWPAAPTTSLRPSRRASRAWPLARQARRRGRHPDRGGRAARRRAALPRPPPCPGHVCCPNGCMATSGTLLRWFQRELAGGAELARARPRGRRVRRRRGRARLPAVPARREEPDPRPATRVASFAGLTSRPRGRPLPRVARGDRVRLPSAPRRVRRARLVRVGTCGSRTAARARGCGSRWSPTSRRRARPGRRPPGASALGAAIAAAMGVRALPGLGRGRAVRAHGRRSGRRAGPGGARTGTRRGTPVVPRSLAPPSVRSPTGSPDGPAMTTRRGRRHRRGVRHRPRDRARARRAWPPRVVADGRRRGRGRPWPTRSAERLATRRHRRRGRMRPRARSSPARRRSTCGSRTPASRSMARFVDITTADYDRNLDVNLRGPFVCGQAAARAMIGPGARRRIINLASMAGKRGRVPVPRALRRIQVRGRRADPGDGVRAGAEQGSASTASARGTSRRRCRTASSAGRRDPRGARPRLSGPSGSQTPRSAGSSSRRTSPVSWHSSGGRGIHHRRGARRQRRRVHGLRSHT